MKQLHAICGLPRSGSTLLCNILSQNPDFHVTSTTNLPGILATITNTVSISEESKSELLHDSKFYDRVKDSMRAFTDKWYADTDKIVFSKGRGWAANALLLGELYPDAKLIVTIRDLRDVFVSVEKQHRKTAVFDNAPDAVAKGIYQTAGRMFADDGIIGSCVRAVEDLAHRKLSNVFFLPYEGFMMSPESVLPRLYEFLEMDMYKHDLNNIPNNATDADEIYLNKFPHKVQSKINTNSVGNWKEYIDADLANTIMQTAPYYNRIFGYGN